jgi:hypothetical protein
MIDRKRIAEMISDILSERKSYKFVPDGMTEHIVKVIEHPGSSKPAYRTNSLIDYLFYRGMRMELEHAQSSFRTVVKRNLQIHAAICFCMDYYGITEGDLRRDGIEYRRQGQTDASMSIDRCCEIFNRFNINMYIMDDEGG